MNKVKLGKITFGAGDFVFLSGPCVIENRRSAMSMAQSLKQITTKLKVPFVFKASYDKANRTSVKSFRGPGIDEGLDILYDIKSRFKVPVISDVHTPEEVVKAKEVLDIIQIPAFLSRQTDLLVEAGKSRKVINIKKGQFLAPWDMRHAVRKVESTGNKKILLTERGASFGYNALVTDFRSIAVMRDLGCPVIIDASHSVQQPGGLGNASGGKSEYIPLMARCGIAAGADGLFMEAHANPEKALSDGPNMIKISKVEALLKQLKNIYKAVH